MKTIQVAILAASSYDFHVCNIRFVTIAEKVGRELSTHVPIFNTGNMFAHMLQKILAKKPHSKLVIPFARA